MSAKVIGAAQRVSNVLGCGFLEKVYENSLVVELRNRRMDVVQQKGIQIIYDGMIVGEYFADLVVSNRVIVELKAAKCLENIHEAQCLNYLRASGLKLCLLMNFARPRLEVRRIIAG